MTLVSQMIKLENYSRFDVVKLLGPGNDYIGIELGVAAGDFSAKMISSGKFCSFWGVDMYADTHDTDQYKQALLKVGIEENYKLLRMTFNDALDLFPDEFFDFIYLDGYAGNGFEGGRTLRAWSSKVKVGGLIAGDDYHTDCPLLQKIVNEFVQQNAFELYVTDGAFDFSSYGHYPSWVVVKSHPVRGSTSLEFENEGIEKALKTKKKKKRAKKIDTLVRKMLPSKTYEKLKNWNKVRKQNRRIRKATK